ncbi:MAG: DUF3368 domain-containing protein [Gloeocapsa sp. UFS-A4-WI-NPMV-4B04]|jgi:predicted nucleic acid-binding protein|nr:DUF3368 domain-containing protein [Gloeocapsa sp. UFS-A4-WI-NPMV-4B04]
MIVVCDTSPICYLLLIGEIQLLPQLYGKVLIPQVIQNELADERSPSVVKAWISQPPEWLVIQTVDVVSDGDLDNLDSGERDAIMLALVIEADLIIVDDLLARQMASSLHLRVTGLLGVLNEAGRQKLVDFPKAIARLQQTTFRASSKLIQSLLQQRQAEDKL